LRPCADLQRVKGKQDFDPGDILPVDQVLACGSGRHHAIKRQQESDA
jgi:hypothetical protein